MWNPAVGLALNLTSLILAILSMLNKVVKKGMNQK